ncbi:MAG: universal stress protein [Phycisphaerae bacterium]|nr:universal stress protein [Phycisphaerae bacterium]
MTYQRILIPLENSPTDRAIIEHIQPFARLCNAELILIHVADGFAARNQEALDLADSEEMTQDRNYLAAIEKELAAAGFSTRSILEKGDPTTQIVAAAEKEHASLIAMATHGHGIIQDVLRGSVASAVRHKTDVPVLLVRAPAAPA